MVRAFAAEFGQHPDFDVFNKTEATTIFIFSIDATRTGYYSDIRCEIERLQSAPPSA